MWCNSTERYPQYVFSRYCMISGKVALVCVGMFKIPTEK